MEAMLSARVSGMQVWFPTDRNMAGCDSCCFWVHDHCDEAAATAIEFGDAVTYYCPQCRRQADAHHKLQVRPCEAMTKRHVIVHTIA